MKLIVSDLIKIRILEELYKNPDKEYTHYELRRKLKLANDSFVNNIYFLEKLGLVKTERIILERTKIRANMTKITEVGKRIFRNYNK